MIIVLLKNRHRHLFDMLQADIALPQIKPKNKNECGEHREKKNHEKAVASKQIPYVTKWHIHS